MAEETNRIKDTILFLTKRNSINLAKLSLSILENLIDEGYNIPEDRFRREKKRIFDLLNDGNREIEDVLKILDIK